MNDVFNVTPRGAKLLAEYERNLIENVAKGQLNLGDLIRADPGDGPHDGMFIQENMKVGMLEVQLQELRHIINTCQIVSKPTQVERVSIGHEVLVKLTYSDGETENLRTIILGKAETSVMKDLIGEATAVSDQSALGQALIGKMVGESFTYQSGTQKIKSEIKSLKIWESAFE